MKTFLTLILSALPLMAQYSNVTVILPDPSASQSYGIPTTLMAVAFPNIIQYAKTAAPSLAFPNSAGIPTNTTLATAITNTGTHANCVAASIPNLSAGSTCSTITLTSTTNLAQCNGLMFATGEMMEIYSVSGTSAVVFRGLIGTTAANHSVGEAVTVTRVGEGSCILKAVLADGIAGIVQRYQSDSTTSAAATAITTNQTTITTTAITVIQ